MFGPLDKMFDFNHDGKLNGFERAAEYEFMSKQGFCGDTNLMIQKIYFLAKNKICLQTKWTELEIAGLDTMELSMMDEEGKARSNRRSGFGSR